MLKTIVMALFTLGWVPVFLLRSERFHLRRAVADADERRAMWNVAAAVTVHVTLVEVTLRHTDAAMLLPFLW
jgi:hypothetical protein